MSAEAYDRLRNAEHRLQMIDDRQTHTLPEGEALPNETELMSLYEVSRPTLREALRILEAMGWLEIRPGKDRPDLKSGLRRYRPVALAVDTSGGQDPAGNHPSRQ